MVPDGRHSKTLASPSLVDTEGQAQQTDCLSYSNVAQLGVTCATGNGGLPRDASRFRPIAFEDYRLQYRRT